MRLAQRVTVLRLADLSRVMDSSRHNKIPLRLEDLVDCFIRPYFEQSAMDAGLEYATGLFRKFAVKR